MSRSRFKRIRKLKSMQTPNQAQSQNIDLCIKNNLAEMSFIVESLFFSFRQKRLLVTVYSFASGRHKLDGYELTSLRVWVYQCIILVTYLLSCIFHNYVFRTLLRSAAQTSMIDCVQLGLSYYCFV